MISAMSAGWSSFTCETIKWLSPLLIASEMSLMNSFVNSNCIYTQLKHCKLNNFIRAKINNYEEQNEVL